MRAVTSAVEQPSPNDDDTFFARLDRFEEDCIRCCTLWCITTELGEGGTTSGHGEGGNDNTLCNNIFSLMDCEKIADILRMLYLMVYYYSSSGEGGPPHAMGGV